MATRAQSMTVAFYAYDTSANTFKTGDSANITMRWTKDGTIAALSATTVTEVDSTNSPGQYKVTLSGTETDCLIGSLSGKSTTANIIVVGPTITFEQTPSAAVNAVGGLITRGTGTGQLNVDGSGNAYIVSNVKKAVALAGFPFLMTDSTNHAPAPTKTVSVTRSINGGTFAVGTLGGSGTATEVAVGIYTIDIGSNDMNGNTIVLRATASGCDDTFVTLITDP